MPIGPILRAMTSNKTRVVLIVLEIAITLAIVANCVNMILDERKQMSKLSGFDDENLVFVRSQIFRPFATQEALNQSIDADLRLIQSVPGVKSVTNTSLIPWQGGGSSTTVRTPDKRTTFQTQTYNATTGLLDTLGVHLVEGRSISQADVDDPGTGKGPFPVIVSKALADLLFPGQHAVGKQFLEQADSTPYLVVGVFDHFYNPYGWPIHEYVFFGGGHSGSIRTGSRYLIRSEPGALRSVIPLVEQRLTARDSQRILEVRTIDSVKDDYFAAGRLVTTAMSAVIALVIFITALGLIGLTSLSVTERTRQIGTRRALGATRRDIVQHFLLENWLMTTGGLALGVAAAYGLNFFLVSTVSGAKMDWRFVASGMLLLWVIGIVATIPAALRGASVSPAVATRSV